MGSFVCSENPRGGGVRSEGSSAGNQRAQSSEVHVAQSGDAGVAIRTYTVQPIDVGERLLAASDRSGRLRNVDGLPLPDLITGESGSEFLSFRTNGDGGCGLHAACGFPNAARELECPSGQQAIPERIRACLPS